MTSKRLLQFALSALMAFTFLLFTGAGSVQAQDWYVNSTEGDDANLGNQMNNGAGNNGPFLTLGAAVAAASNGDTIAILAGAYAEDIDVSGKALTLQVQSSGGTTVATFTGDLVIDANTSMSGGSGTFTLASDGTPAALIDAQLTLDSGVLTINAGFTVTVEDGSIAGNAPTYAGLVNMVYDPTNGPGPVVAPLPAFVTTGLEFPPTFAGGDLTVDGAYDFGTLTVAQAVVGADEISVDGDADVVFQGAVAFTTEFAQAGAGDTDFESTVTGGAFVQDGAGTTDVTGAASVDYVDQAGGTLNFDDALTVNLNNAGDAINVAPGATFTSDGTLNAVGGDITNSGDMTTGDVDLSDNDLVNNLGGTFTSSGTLFVGDDGLAGAFAGGTLRVDNDGTMTLANVQLERVDTAGDDVDDHFVAFDNSDDLTISGTITEYSDDDTGAAPDVLTAALEFINSSQLTISASNTASGDMNNTGTVSPGGTLTLAGTGLTDLGDFDTGTLQLTGAGEDATGLTSVNNLIMGLGTAGIAQDVDAAGNVTLNSGAAVTHTVNFDVTGTLTINGGTDIDDAGPGPHVVGALVVGGAGTVLGTGGDEDGFDVTNDANIGSATLSGFVDADGSLQADGAVVNGNLSSKGNMSLDDTVVNFVGGLFVGDVNAEGNLTLAGVTTIDGLFNVDGNVTQTGTTTIGDGVRGPGVGLSDVGGSFDIDGGVTFGNNGGDSFDITVGGVDIAIPDGSLDMGQVDLIVEGDFVGGTMTNADHVHFQLQNNGAATFEPAPNTEIATFEITGSNAVLTLEEGFEITGGSFVAEENPANSGLTLNNDAIFALTDNTVTLTGVNSTLTIDDEAAVTTSNPTGAVVFSSGGVQGIDVTGAPTTTPSLSNIRVNAAGTMVTIYDDLNLTGDVSLNNGTLVIGGAGGDVVSMVGASATISINPDQGSITEAPGDLTGSWDVYYFGGAAGPDVTGPEIVSANATGSANDVEVNLDADGNILAFPAASIGGDLLVSDGVVNMTGIFTIGGNLTVGSADTDFTPLFDQDADVQVNGNATFNSSGDSPDLGGQLTVSGNLSVGAGVMPTGVGSVTLDGAGATHTLTGALDVPARFEADATVNGSASTADNSGAFLLPLAVDLSATVVMNDIQEANSIFVTDGDLTVNFVDDGDQVPVAGGDVTDNEITGDITVSQGSLTLNGDGEITKVDDIFVDEGGTLTLGSDLDTDGGGNGVTLGDDGAAGGVATLDLGGNTLTVSSALDFYAEADSDISNGTIEMSNVASDIGTNGASVDNLTLTAVGTVNSDVRVEGTLSVQEDAELDADLILAGDATFGAGDDLLDGAGAGGEFRTVGTTLTLAGDVTITNFNVASATTTEVVSAAGGPWTITSSAFTMTSGTYDIGSQNQMVTGSYTYVAGMNASSSGYFMFSGPTYATGGNDVDFDNVHILGGGLDMTDLDGLTVNNNLILDGGFVDMDDDNDLADYATVTVGDNAMITVDDTEFDVAASFGTGIDVLVEDQEAGAVTTTMDNEIPSVFASLTLNDAGTLGGAKSITVDAIDANAAFDNNNGAGTTTVTDGGTVNVALTGAFTEAYIPAGDWTLTYDGAANITTSATDWVGVPTTVNISSTGDVTLHDDVSAVNANVSGTATLDLDGNNVTVLGDFTQTSGGEVTNGGSMIFAGTTGNQSLAANGGISLPSVTINNGDGVTLSGGDLTITTNMALTDGVFTTGDNKVILPHGGTASQGFTQANGVINGNVSKFPGLTGAAPNRIEFPLGVDGSVLRRTFAITFNSPAADLGLAAGTIELVASFDESNPMGTNGLPIATVDSESNPLNIGRYPYMNWRVTSNPPVSPSVDYDIEYRAEGYANFENEEIERTRAIRRQDGDTDNFWILTSPDAGDNDNFAVSSTYPVVIARNAVGAINADGVLFTFGLEQNMTATNPAALVLNAGNSESVDLTSVFAGGDESYTYAVVNSDSDVSTGAIAGDDLTITGVATGDNEFTITATDGFGDSATASVVVTVNAAFEADVDLADLAPVNAGAVDATVDGSVSHVGGTAPYAYGVTSSDVAVATAVVGGAGLVTVTYVGVGTATIELTTTDSEGDTVVDSFDVTVNPGMSAAGGLAGVMLDEGDTADVDASAEFTGGTITGDYAYTASSDDETVATVSVSGATVTVAGVSPYVVTDGEVTADAAPATITVTATDDLGASSTSSFTAEVNPVLGNVDGSGSASPAGASATLDYFLSLSTLTAKQQTAADYNADASITPYDAALIFDAFFNGKDEIVSNPNADLTYGELLREASVITIPVQIAGDLNDVVSGSFVTSIDPAMATIVGVTSELGDGWMFNHVVAEDGTIKLAFAGNGSIDASGTIATVAIELNSANAQFNLGGEGATNNNATMSIDAVEVAELPETFALHGNYPNPFNPSTSISFDLPESADVEIHVIDMIGRQVMTLPATTIAAGANRTVQVNASQLASGPYFYRVIAKMESKTLVETGRMMLVK